MSRFDDLTKYILTIHSDSIGEWVIDKNRWNTSTVLVKAGLKKLQ